MSIKKSKILLLILSLFLITGCNLLHGHKYKGATCTEPKTCIECGATSGEPLGHKYSEATCTESKTCKTCGETLGEALGHTTDVGKCTRCNNYVNESIVKKEIGNLIKSITESINIATSHINKANYESLSDSFIKFTQSYNELKSTEEKMNNIIYLCNDIEGLNNLKNKINTTIKSIPNQLKAQTLNDLMTFLDEYEIYLEKWQDVLNEYQDILKLYE